MTTPIRTSLGSPGNPGQNDVAYLKGFFGSCSMDRNTDAGNTPNQSDVALEESAEVEQLLARWLEPRQIETPDHADLVSRVEEALVSERKGPERYRARQILRRWRRRVAAALGRTGSKLRPLEYLSEPARLGLSAFLADPKNRRGRGLLRQFHVLLMDGLGINAVDPIRERALAPLRVVWAGLRISDQIVHPFRFKSSTCFGGNRPAISEQVVH